MTTTTDKDALIREPDVYAKVGWPPRWRNISEDGRELGRRAAKVFREALNGR